MIHDFEALCEKYSDTQVTTPLPPSEENFIRKFEDFNAQFQQLVNNATGS